MCFDTLESGTSIRCSTKNEKAGRPVRSNTIVDWARGARVVSVSERSSSATIETVKTAARQAATEPATAIATTAVARIDRRIPVTQTHGAIQQRECQRCSSLPTHCSYEGCAAEIVCRRNECVTRFTLPRYGRGGCRC